MADNRTPRAVLITEGLSRIAFAVAAVALIGLSFGLVVYGLTVVANGFRDNVDLGGSLLDAVGYMVIAIAVYDVAKYLLEEEVVRVRELRSAAEARRSLTKFLSTIAIAVFLEALVAVFEAGKDDVRLMLYPTMLLAAGTFMILGLGLYIRFSAEAEGRVGEKDERADEERDAADHGANH